MVLPKPIKSLICVVLAILIVHVPAYATGQKAMIATSQVVSDLDRAQTESRIRDYLSSEEVQKLLIERGVSPEEASARLAQLSEAELRQLAGQVEHAKAGGDILVTVLIVVLIIFLIRRM